MVNNDTLDALTQGVIPPVGTQNYTITSTWNPESFSWGGGYVTAPQGWTTEYTTDGSTWQTFDPNAAPTASDVKSFRASGSLESLGNQVYQSTAATQAVVSADPFVGGSGGDGYDAILAGDLVLNVFHHSSQISVDCHVKGTGQSCYTGASLSTLFDPSSGFGDYSTSSGSTGVWRSADKSLYAFAERESDNKLGVVCVNFSDPARPVLCETPFIVLGDGAGWLVAREIGGTTVDANGVAWTMNNLNNSLMCFVIATALPCANNGWSTGATDYSDSTNGYQFGRVSAIDGNVYYLTPTRFGCYDPIANDQCNSDSPAVITDAVMQYPPLPVRNSSGNLIAVCSYMHSYCMQPAHAGTEVTTPTLPSGIKNLMDTVAIPDWNTQNAGQWAEDTTTRKIYLNTDAYGNYDSGAGASNDVLCWDFAADAQCAGFDGANKGLQIYAITKDPTVPDCYWINGNAAEIAAFTGSTGEAGCTSTRHMVQMPYSAVAPRMSCDESGRVVEWDSMDFVTASFPASSPGGTDWSDYLVTVFKADGTQVGSPLTPTALGHLDLTGLSVSATGTDPTFRITAPDAVSFADLLNIQAVVKIKAQNPQLCFDVTAWQNCPDGSVYTGSGNQVGDGYVKTTVATQIGVNAPSVTSAIQKVAGTETAGLCATTLDGSQYPLPDPCQGAVWKKKTVNIYFTVLSPRLLKSQKAKLSKLPSVICKATAKGYVQGSIPMGNASSLSKARANAVKSWLSKNRDFTATKRTASGKHRDHTWKGRTVKLTVWYVDPVA
jgi:hypothetical protein